MDTRKLVLFLVSVAGLAQTPMISAPPGTSVSSLPPYLKIGSVLSIPSDNNAKASLPSASGFGSSGIGTWTVLGTITPTISTATNGNLIITSTNTTAWLLSAPSQIVSIEVAFDLTLSVNNGTTNAGIYFCDSTNSKLFDLLIQLVPGAGNLSVFETTNTFNCAVPSGNPSFSSVQFTGARNGGMVHLKGVVAGGVLTFSESRDGGITFIPYPTTYSVGTINKIGLTMNSGTMYLDSVVVN